MKDDGQKTSPQRLSIKWSDIRPGLGLRIITNIIILIYLHFFGDSRRQAPSSIKNRSHLTRSILVGCARSLPNSVTISLISVTGAERNCAWSACAKYAAYHTILLGNFGRGGVS